MPRINGHLPVLVRTGLEIATQRPQGAAAASHALTVRSLLARAQMSLTRQIEAGRGPGPMTPDLHAMQVELAQVSVAKMKLERAFDTPLPPALTPMDEATARSDTWIKEGYIEWGMLKDATDVLGQFEDEQGGILAQLRWLEQAAPAASPQQSSGLLLETRRELALMSVRIMKLKRLVQNAAEVNYLIEFAMRKNFAIDPDTDSRSRYYEWESGGTVPISRATEDWTIYVRPESEHFVNAWKVIVQLLSASSSAEPWFGDMQVHVRLPKDPLGRDKDRCIEIDVNRHMLRPLVEFLSERLSDANIDGRQGEPPPPFTAPFERHEGIFYKHHRREEVSDPFDTRLDAETIQEEGMMIEALDGQLAAVTHIGGRKGQEDALVYVFNPKTGELSIVVGDGMGGHGNGEEASIKFSTAAGDQFDHNRSLAEALQAGENAVLEAASEHLQRGHMEAATMGLVYVALQLRFGQLAKIMYKGDARAYYVDPDTGDIIQLFEEHNVATRMLVEELGLILPARNATAYYERFQTHPKKSNPYRAVMLKVDARTNRPRLLKPGEAFDPPGEITLPTYMPDETLLVPKQGGQFILCSDGLHDFLPLWLFEKIVRSKLTPTQKASALRDASILSMKAARKENALEKIVQRGTHITPDLIPLLENAAKPFIGTGGDNFTAVVVEV